MGFLSKVMTLFTQKTEIDKPTLPSINKQSSGTSPKQANYYGHVKKQLFKSLSTITLEIEGKSSWNSFFSANKTNDTLLGFEKRSRKKFRHLYHNENIIIAEAAGVFEIISKENVKQFSLKETELEKMSPVAINEQGIILHSNHKIAFIDIPTQKAFLFEFSWKPFTFAIGQGFWLIGTRETYDGPGELYSFNINGTLKWGISFKETISSMFGEIGFTSYLLSVSPSSDEIFVGSMDRLYRINPQDASLKGRIAISELKKQDIKKKHEQLTRSLSVSPKTEDEAISQFASKMAAQFTMSMDNMTVNSPFIGFTQDPESNYLFLMERDGRVSAWDNDGNLVWINTFKNQGRFKEEKS